MKTIPRQSSSSRFLFQSPLAPACGDPHHWNAARLARCEDLTCWMLERAPASVAGHALSACGYRFWLSRVVLVPWRPPAHSAACWHRCRLTCTPLPGSVVCQCNEGLPRRRRSRQAQAVPHSCDTGLSRNAAESQALGRRSSPPCATPLAQYCMQLRTMISK